MLRRLVVPEHLQRNEAGVARLGYESTGRSLIQLATRRMGLTDLATADILDVGCGVRFTQAIINTGIPVRSYTGVEVFKPIVEFLSRAVTPHDPRFRFIHLDVRNTLYNPASRVRLADLTCLPGCESYDVIWLFSVFTHLDEGDAAAMLRLLRRHVRPRGVLFFSAFIDPTLDGFEDRESDCTLLKAHFGYETMQRLIARGGWLADAFFEREPGRCIMDHFICRPRT